MIVLSNLIIHVVVAEGVLQVFEGLAQDHLGLDHGVPVPRGLTGHHIESVHRTLHLTTPVFSQHGYSGATPSIC